MAIKSEDFLRLAKENEPVPDKERIKDLTWIKSEVDTLRWNQAFPYQLIVVERGGPNTSENEDLPSLYHPKGKGWTYTLPIPPENVSIQMPFAIQTWITMGGSIEEHNGAPIRMIHMRGSFGVNFGREPNVAPIPPVGFLETVFAGTIEAATKFKNTKAKATNIDNQLRYQSPSGALARLTGYYQFRVLQSFFENYAALKKTVDGRNARLALALWKDEAVYLVQPMAFAVQKTAESPLEYTYDLQFKATKRIKLDAWKANVIKSHPPLLSRPNALAQFLNSVQAVRSQLQKSQRVIAALGQDVANLVFETAREMALGVKDILGVPLAVADMGDKIIQDLYSTVADITDTSSYDALRERFSQLGGRFADLGGDLANMVSADDDSVFTYQIAQIFNNPKENFEILGDMPIGALQIPPNTMGKIADERERVRNLDRTYYQERRDAIATTAAEFAASVGLGNEVFSRTYGLSIVPPAFVATPVDEDYDIIFGLNRLVMEMNKLVITNEREPQARISAIDSVAGLAARSGIAFTVPRGKYAVPFPYGSTLETLAARYLKNPNRWHEIAVLNGLQTPYVDEEGFELLLLTNGASNQVMVNDASHFFVGQPVWLESRAVAREKRRINRIEKLTGNQVLVTVDGEPDLDKYGTLARATIQAFLPNTVNSQQLIFIPSDRAPIEQDFQSNQIPGIGEFDSYLQVGGIDLLLTSNNDLVVTPDGDTRWAVGLTNIIQKLRLVVSTRQGTLLQHPEYGLPIEVGMSVADIDPEALAKAAEEMLKDDPSFSGVTGARVSVNGPVAQLGIVVEVAGTDKIVPVSVEIR